MISYDARVKSKGLEYYVNPGMVLKRLYLSAMHGLTDKEALKAMKHNGHRVTRAGLKLLRTEINTDHAELHGGHFVTHRSGDVRGGERVWRAKE